MAEDKYEVIYRGDLVPGQHIDAVKDNLATIFKTDLQGIAHLFGGKLVIVKSDLDQATADRYKAAMEKAGAMASIRPQQASTDEEAAKASKAGELTLAPLGADMLPERTPYVDKTSNIPTDHLTLSETGSDLLAPDEKAPFVEKQIDTSHLKIEQ